MSRRILLGMVRLRERPTWGRVSYELAGVWIGGETGELDMMNSLQKLVNGPNTRILGSLSLDLEYPRL